MIKRFGEVTVIQLSDSDSNIYLIGNTVIDAGTGLNFTRLRDVLRVLKRGLDEFSLVVNTHCHFDHVGGNGYFLNAKVAVHAYDAPVLEKGDTELSAAYFFDGNLRPRNVDLRLQDGQVLKAGSLDLQVVHTPGHTQGSVCLHAKKQGLLFTGDTVFGDGIGRTDFPNSVPDQMLPSLQKLARLDVKTVFPGHGDPFDKNILDAVVKKAEEHEDHI